MDAYESLGLSFEQYTALDMEKTRKILKSAETHDKWRRILIGVVFPLGVIITYFILGKIAFGESARIPKSIGLGLCFVGPILFLISMLINKSLMKRRNRKIADA